jgi:hypothetical protein
MKVEKLDDYLESSEGTKVSLNNGYVNTIK